MVTRITPFGLSMTVFTCLGVVVGVWAGDTVMGGIYGLAAGIIYVLIKVIRQSRK